MCSHQWNQPSNKGEGGHEDRTETHLGTFDGCLQDRGTLSGFLHGKLDDQYRVLTQEPDEHDEPNLGIDVVGEAHGLDQHERSEHPGWQGEHNGQWNDEAFVLRSEYKVHEHQYDKEDINGFVP